MRKMVQEDSTVPIRTPKLSRTEWDRAKLTEMGLKKEFVLELDEYLARELVKGLLYLRERYGSSLEAKPL
jgi:hypothetical protein